MEENKSFISNGMTDSHVITSHQVSENNKERAKRAKPLKARNLLGLTVEEWTKLDPDFVSMSPPCQPYTRYVLLL